MTSIRKIRNYQYGLFLLPVFDFKGHSTIVFFIILSPGEGSLM